MAGEPVHDSPHLGVSGPVILVRPDGSTAEFTPIQQRLLARLVVAAPRPVHREELADAMWRAGRPASARQAIHNQISRIRAVAGEFSIETIGDRYRLGLVTDIDLLRDAVTRAERLLAAVADGDGGIPGPNADGAAHPVRNVFDELDRLLPPAGLEVLGDLDHADDIERFRTHARTIVTAAEHRRVEAALRLQRPDWALIEAERLLHASPLDERAAANYAWALAMAGRRSDALTMVTQLRKQLRMHVGIEAGSLLGAAEAEILHGAARGPARRPARGAPPPLAGRNAELRRILQAVAQRRPVRVRGEHGSGVSRMLFEVRARLVNLGVRAVLVRADEHPYSATSLVEELLFELGASRNTAENAISAFAAVVEALDADHPTVFLVDDVQFIGPSAWQALRIVAEAEYGGLVLGGHGHVLELDGEVEVPLGPLTRDDIAAIARYGGAVDDDNVQRIFEISGGNPLAARLLAESVDSLPHPSAGQSAAAALPEFAEFLHRLVGDLGTERRHDLELAAVAGDGYPVAAFGHVTWAHVPQLPDSLVETDARGAVRFRHSAVQAYVYQTLPRGVVLDLHYELGLAARAAGAPAGTVASHLLAAAELDPEAAIEAARDAAREASLLGAHADAADWLAQAGAVAARGVVPPALTVQLSIDHADALRLAGDSSHLDALIAAAHSALELADDSLVAAAGFALLQLGGSSPAGGPDARISGLTERMVSSIGDPQRRAPVQAAASLAWSMTGHADRARALFDEAEAAAVDPGVRLAVLPFAYLAVGRPGDLPRRATLAEELLGLARAAGEPVPLWEGLHLTFSVALQRGDGAGIRTALGEMTELVDRIGDVGRRWSMLYCQATLAEIDGDLGLSEHLATQAHSVFSPVSPERAGAAYYGQLLQTRLRQGRLRELGPVVEQMVVAQPGVTAWHAAAALVIADALRRNAPGDAAGRTTDVGAAAAPNRDAAIAHARSALDLAQDDFLWLAAHVVGGRAAAMLGDDDLIAHYTKRLAPWSELVCWQGTCSYGPVAAVLAELADAAGDRAATREFLGIAERLTTSLASGQSDRRC
jgi:DNA-binding SARP family transcriptional activator